MSQRFIENVAATDITTGFHYDCGPNAMLISITDPAGWKPTRKHDFKEVYEFEFLDAEDADAEEYGEEPLFSDAQAEEIIRLLQRAQENAMNVVVHCYAGICRSGAVVEVAEIMGFTPSDRYRQPNLRVKSKLMKVLGLTYE
jgi:predicted protein tyrosine phosphatase